MSADDHCTATPELFSCNQCGDCCKGFGGTYLSDDDIDAIADFVGISRQELIQRHCSRSGHRWVLSQAESGYCTFWDHNCTIHPVKPRMCRAWPYIGSILVDTINWFSMADSCPGMRTDVSEEQIRRCVQQHLGTSARAVSGGPKD